MADPGELYDHFAPRKFLILTLAECIFYQALLNFGHLTIYANA